MQTMTSPRRIEYRFNATTSSHVCPVCGTPFETRIGSWPYVAGTTDPLCGADRCVDGEVVAATAPCDTRFAFGALEAATIAAIRDAAAQHPVAEAMRRASLDDSLPDRDRALLQRAAIDLQFCEAKDTAIEAYEPSLTLRTCGEAAAEMLLSGCGEIV